MEEQKKKQWLVQVGTRVWNCRTQRGLSREKLAERLDITPQYVSDIEQGKKCMSMSIFVEMSQVLEVGYLLKRRHWHQGYAAEAAEGCKRYAFEKLGQRAVYSVIKADNAASIRVAERIGMEKADEFTTQYFNGDMLHFLYRVERAEG